MFRSPRARRQAPRRPLHLGLIAAGATLAAVPSLATAAAPPAATAFVRGATSVNADDSPQRAFVGDVNGDGRDDAAFAYGSQVQVVYGASPTANVDLTADLGTRGYRVALGSNGGVRDISAAGDFDRDGIDDFVISTDLVSFVVYGTRSTTGTISAAAGGRFTALTGKGATDIEDDVDRAGDFDGDGYGDLVVNRGAIGAAIVSGGPRVDTIALGAQGSRVSLVNSTQRCGFVWFTFKCVYMGVPVEPIGDFDGDGLDDLTIENANNPANYVLYGRTGRFTTTAEAGSGKTTLPTPTQGEVPSEVSDYTGVGDITGDGLEDVLAWGTVIVPGRGGRPSSISNSSPVIRLTSPTLSRLNASAAGDQDGDGRPDLALLTGGNGSGNGYVPRVLTNFPRTAPATVNADTGTVIGGVSDSYAAIVGGGDLDGDGLDDLIAASAYPGESAYLVTHSGGSTGPVARPARLEGTLSLVDGANNPVYYWSGTLQATCAGRTSPKLPLGYPVTVLFTDASEGDTCTVSAEATIDNPAPYAACTWVDSVYVDYSTPVTTPDRSFTLAASANRVDVVRRCQLPEDYPPGSFYQSGWWASGGVAAPTPGDVTLALTNGANQTRGLMWGTPVDLRNSTIEFNLVMAGGNGSAEGAGVAFVKSVNGSPRVGRLGLGGAKLGLGNFYGASIAFDVNQNPGDPSNNFIGFTDGTASGSTLRWLRTASAVAPLRDSAGHRIKIVNRNGTTTVSVDGTVRLSGPLAVPASSFLAFTAATSATYQYTTAYNLSIKPS